MKKTPLLAVGLIATAVLTGCATKADGERNDKLESFNRTMFDFNYKVMDRYVAENSVIIRSGLTLALKRLPNLKIQPVELLSVEALHDCLRTQYPDILVVNPTFGDYFDVARFREETTGKGIRVVALVSSFIDEFNYWEL